MWLEEACATGRYSVGRWVSKPEERKLDVIRAVKFHTTTQMEDLGMLLQTECPYSKHPKKIFFEEAVRTLRAACMRTASWRNDFTLLFR